MLPYEKMGRIFRQIIFVTKQSTQVGAKYQNKLGIVPKEGSSIPPVTVISYRPTLLQKIPAAEDVESIKYVSGRFYFHSKKE